LSLKGGWSNFDSQAYCLYGENQNCETAFKDKELQATVDGWCKIQVLFRPGKTKIPGPIISIRGLPFLSPESSRRSPLLEV
jgi:hypothetical protein